MSQSPWGNIQYSTPILRGIRMVSCAGHEGLMISESAARKYLSDNAKNVGMPYGNYLCYEGDAAVCVPLLDSEDIRNAFFAKIMANGIDERPDSVKKESMNKLIETAATYYPQYFLSSITRSDCEDVYDEMKKVALEKVDREAHFNKKDAVFQFLTDPLIGPSYVIAVTTDGTRHIVPLENSRKVKQGNPKDHLYTISDFETVSESDLPPLTERYIAYLRDAIKEAEKHLASANDPGNPDRKQAEDRYVSRLGYISYHTELFCRQLIGEEQFLTMVQAEESGITAVKEKIKELLEGKHLNEISSIYGAHAYSREECEAPWLIRETIMERHQNTNPQKELSEDVDSLSPSL